MKEILFDDFKDEQFTKAVWRHDKPWGNISHKSFFTRWENVEFTEDGLRFFHTPLYKPFRGVETNSGMIMLNTETAFQYGRFSAEITAPYGTHCAFWLLSDVRQRGGIRSILPELDVAEFGVENNKYQLNQAIHYWMPDGQFKRFNREYDDDDFKFKKQRNKLSIWLDGKHTYSVEINKLFTTFYIDGVRSFRILSRDSGSYLRPLFTHTHANWQSNTHLEDVFLHSITIEQ